MGLKADSWIREKSLKERMIEPFCDGQVGKDVVSYGVSSYGYDIRVGREFKIFTNVNSTVVDPKEFDDKNVIDFEPHIALFVPDKDPLIFYSTIADIATNQLKPRGKLYFEVNEQFGNETVDLLSLKGFKNIILRKDINGKERMLKAEWSN